MTTDRGWPVTAADRAALLHKYRLLAGWRRARDSTAAAAVATDPGVDDDSDDEANPTPGESAAGVGRADRAALRALADQFPGALRELDVLGLREIERRIAHLTIGDPGSDDWIAWIVAFHALMRAALATKRDLRGQPPVPAALPALARNASSIAGTDLDEAFVLAVARPPAGRLGVVVLRAIAVRFAVAPARIATTLFPPRRPSPYAFDPS